jgi:hypothetical protein
MASEEKDDNLLTWISDTGATSHMTNDDKGMFNFNPTISKLLLEVEKPCKMLKNES